jgi:alkylated DNA repair dioxygenase AlkB
VIVQQRGDEIMRVIDKDGLCEIYSDGLRDFSVEMADIYHECKWYRPRVKVFGKEHIVPRLVAFFADSGVQYHYSGLTHEGVGWAPLLGKLKNFLEDTYGMRANSALLNYYRDGRDKMGAHSDDEVELGPNPTIFSINLGAERTMRFIHKVSNEKISIELKDRDVLKMSGPLQHFWRHEIPQRKRVLAPRLNITFRQIQNNSN